MLSVFSLWQSKFASRITSLLLAMTALLFGGASISAQAPCHPVHGHTEQHLLSAPACTSPVGLCTQGSFSGGIQGDYRFIGSSLNATTDTPVTSVSLYTGDSTVHAQVGNGSGDLFLKDAGAFKTTDNGEFVEIASVVGGTGSLTGASGVLQIGGTFTFINGGQADYTGMVCVP